ncbi:uncharacterized protein LOC135122549 isoform X2 [Zophobas morio]
MQSYKTYAARIKPSSSIQGRQINVGAEQDGITKFLCAGPSALESVPKIDSVGSNASVRQPFDISVTNTTSRKILNRRGVKQRTTLNFTPKEKKLYNEAKRLQKEVGRLQNQARKRRDALYSIKKILRNQGFVDFVEGLSPRQRRFFENHIRNVNRKPKGRSFTLKQKADATAIWKRVPNTYKLLSTMFTLPTIDTLRATLNRIPIEPGINKPIFEVLRKQVVRKMGRRYRLCTLIFGELPIEPHLDCLPSEDRVVGLEDDGAAIRTEKIADHVCVFMLRGIFGRWKQPVAFAFCKNSMLAANIVRFYTDIVKEATAIGLNIIASVCDQDATNYSDAIDMLLQDTKRLAILENGKEIKENVIRIGDHEVIPLFDPPHLLKSLRNNLLTKDLLYLDKAGVERRVSWSFFEKVYELDQTHPDKFKGMPQITVDHVKPNLRGHKMKVRYASQVLSRHVAAFINAYSVGGPLPRDARYTSDFFLFMNFVFDSVNGGFGYDGGKVSRKLLRLKHSHHTWWVKGKHMFGNMRFEPRNAGDQANPPVLQGWCRTLNGFMIIDETLKKLGYRFFPEKAFHQDPLENFFDQLKRYRVRYINPSCRAFVSFYKALMMKNFWSYRCRGSNCEQDEDSFVVTIRDFLGPKINRKCIEDP